MHPFADPVGEVRDLDLSSGDRAKEAVSRADIVDDEIDTVERGITGRLG